MTFYEYYAGMAFSELLRELKHLVAQAQRKSIWADQEMQDRLLPAFLAMRELTAQPGKRKDDPNRPTFEQVCEMLGTTAATVRSWKRRKAAEFDLRQVLGEKKHPQDKQEDEVLAVLKEKAKCLERLTRAVLESDDEEEAERIAMAIAERFRY